MGREGEREKRSGSEPANRVRVGSRRPRAGAKMENYVQKLAQIGLNLANVEQFLSIACSLADEDIGANGGPIAPAGEQVEQLAQIGREVRQAAKEAHSAGLLIDHLRSLFCHQDAISKQAAAFTSLAASGGLESRQLRQAQLELGRAQCLQANLGHALQPQAQARPQQQHHQSHQQQQQPKAHEQNLNLFSYSNKRTLERAAQCLVSNVAKILYLTDAFVLQRSSPAAPSNVAQTEVSRLACLSRGERVGGCSE